MYDFFEDLHNDESEKEPSFSLYEFKKWLSKQKPNELTESKNPQKESKEEFKKKVKDRLRKRKPKDS